MGSLNLGQDVANKRETKIWTAAYIVAKSDLLFLAVTMRRYGSLIKINPSAFTHQNMSLSFCVSAKIPG